MKKYLVVNHAALQAAEAVADSECEACTECGWPVEDCLVTLVSSRHDRVSIARGGCRCPVHGFVAGAEYSAQAPAPCGCEWVGDEKDGFLQAVPFLG